MRQRPLDAVELRFDRLREGNRVGRRLLLDADDHGGIAHVAGIAALDACRKVDLRDLAQQNAMTLAGGDHEVAQVLDAVGQADVADQILARMLIDEAAAGVDAEPANGGLQLGQRDFQAAHHHRIGGDAILAHLAADRDDLGDPGNSQKLRPDDEIGDLAQLHGRGRARDGDQHDLAHDGGDRPHLRLHAVRQPALHAGEPLGHLLPGAVNLRLPPELHVDDRQPDAGGRAHAHGAGNAAHGGLDRVGDELLDLLRRQAFGLAEEHDRRTVEVGEDIDGQARQHEAAVDDEHQGCGQHQQPAPQAGLDDAIEHGALTAPGSRAAHP